METTNNITVDPIDTADQPEVAPEQEHEPVQLNEKIRRRRKIVIIAFILVLAGWLTMMLYPPVSIACAVIGLVLAIVGVRIPPGPRRDIATTSIVAASVLVLVYALFATVLYLI